MEIKKGDLIQDRYVVKEIMLEPKKQLKEYSFVLYDKKEDNYVVYSEKQIKELLNIKE